MTYLSDDELDAVQLLDRETPYLISGISQGMFSLARHYGGMTYQGKSYIYLPEHDECVRADVVKAVEKMRKKSKIKPQAVPVTLDIFEGRHEQR